MRYRHVLVPVDFTESVTSAIEAALEMAAQHQARTTLLHVIEEIDDGSNSDPDDDITRFYAEVESSVRDRLSELARRFQQAGLDVDQEIVVGRRVRTIVQFSATESVDLIVMRSRRADPRQPQQAIASVSHQVSVLSQCPVMLIK
jgi:universal stress protein A